MLPKRFLHVRIIHEEGYQEAARSAAAREEAQKTCAAIVDTQGMRNRRVFHFQLC